jgi:hypothetical protein
MLRTSPSAGRRPRVPGDSPHLPEEIRGRWSRDAASEGLGSAARGALPRINSPHSWKDGCVCQWHPSLSGMMLVSPSLPTSAKDPRPSLRFSSASRKCRAHSSGKLALPRFSRRDVDAPSSVQQRSRVTRFIVLADKLLPSDNGVSNAAATRSNSERPSAARAELVEKALTMTSNTAPFDLTHHPAMAIPGGMSDGLPVSVMLLGRQSDEATIDGAAHAFEQSTDWNSM